MSRQGWRWGGGGIYCVAPVFVISRTSKKGRSKYQLIIYCLQTVRGRNHSSIPVNSIHGLATLKKSRNKNGNEK